MGYIPREDRGKEILEPDVMTPVQFFGAFRRRSWQDGERRLMSAVLQEGIETFQKHAASRDELGRTLFEEAHRWVVARFDRSLFSFATVCEMLEIDADYLRTGLLRWLEEQGPRTRATRGTELARFAPAERAPGDRVIAERLLMPRRVVRGPNRVVNGS
jgi:hypothetical protein